MLTGEPTQCGGFFYCQIRNNGLLNLKFKNSNPVCIFNTRRQSNNKEIVVTSSVEYYKRVSECLNMNHDANKVILRLRQ